MTNTKYELSCYILRDTMHVLPSEIGIGFYIFFPGIMTLNATDYSTGETSAHLPV